MPTKSTPSAVNPAEASPEAGVRVQVASRSRSIPPVTSFRTWARAAASGRTDVTIRLVGATEARQLNLAYRGRDYATNVLTFAYEPSCGDVVLCPQVVAREARAQGKSLRAHYAHLTVHAILHLRGYEHELQSNAARMERAEIRILRRLGFPKPYIA